MTGDVVTLGGPRGVAVRAAEGREHIGFRSSTDPDGDVHVVPEDAVGPVSSGRVDGRLFDVTGLVRAGYDDSRRDDLPLIVDYPGATPRAAGARAVRELPALSAVALRADRTAAFWAGTTATKIWLDAPVTASLDRSVPRIGAPEAWAAGHTGAGTTVAVLDSGIDVTHPDLDDAVTGAQDFTDAGTGTDDRLGHGTHVASIITGSGERYRGVAPDAALLNGKVLDDNGEGFESWIVAGMEWATTSGADVVNLSLGSPWGSDGTDPMSQTLNRLTAETGTLFVVAAGNIGPGVETVTSPAAADAALAVGATDREDRVAEFSSRGPRWQDGAVKPDITAPGVGIAAAKAASGRIGEPVEDGYVALSGTSMAAPHVAGAAAVLAGQHPDWSAETLKSALMATSAPNAEASVFEQGAGRVDVAAAVGTPVVATPASIGLGTVPWPHEDNEPIHRTIAYANTGTTAVTLHLEADVAAPDGGDAPAGMFRLSPAEVTVPPGGRTEVTLTTDTSVPGADGTYGGVVVATGGETSLRTPVTVAREVESHDVTLSFLDLEGRPTPNYLFRLVSTATPDEYRSYDESGTTVVRLPRGEYYLDGTIGAPDETGRNVDIVEPRITVPGPARYVFDARDGVSAGITVDRPDARSATARISARMVTSWGETGYDLPMTRLDDVLVRPSRTRAPGRFELTLEAQFARPAGQGFHASPYLYNVRHRDDSGGVPADLTSHAGDRRLVKVVSEHAVGLPDHVGLREGFLSMPLPFTLTEYYTPNEEWFPFFDEVLTPDTQEKASISQTKTPVVYEPGRTVRERWNVGVFGPGLPRHTLRNTDTTFRWGDLLQVSVGMFSDRDPRREGWSYLGTGSLSLYRGDELVGELPWHGFGQFIVPPEAADYTLRMDADRPSPLSSRVSAKWTFPSARTGEADATPIPLLAVRFAPDLDDHNATRAGERFRFPVVVQRNGAERPGRVNTPTVEVSYDDGQTWVNVRLTRARDQWVAEVDHPRDAEFVSLRASVSDGEGFTAEHTVIHAYALTP